MIHARKDYNRIQDPKAGDGGIPNGEPVFLLRAKDLCAPDVVMYWAERAEALGASVEIVEMAKNHAVSMLTWGEKNGRQVPDLPNGDGK